MAFRAVLAGAPKAFGCEFMQIGRHNKHDVQLRRLASSSTLISTILRKPKLLDSPSHLGSVAQWPGVALVGRGRLCATDCELCEKSGRRDLSGAPIEVSLDDDRIHTPLYSGGRLGDDALFTSARVARRTIDGGYKTRLDGCSDRRRVAVPLEPSTAAASPLGRTGGQLFGQRSNYLTRLLP